MKNVNARWNELVMAAMVGALLVYPGMLIYRSVGAVLHEIGDAMIDASYFRFDREHHLPHGYGGRMDKNLTKLQRALIAYCRQHKGRFPPMQDAVQARQALLPYVKRDAYFSNPATNLPFQPNAALQGYAYKEIISPDQTLAFYDPQPPSTYQEVYFVLLSGRVGHVDIKDWPELEKACRLKKKED